MADWLILIAFLLLFVCAYSCHQLLSMVRELRLQLEHMQMLLYKELRKMQGDEYEND